MLRGLYLVKGENYEHEFRDLTIKHLKIHSHYADAAMQLTTIHELAGNNQYFESG